uniref:LOW QUALITY PROTEIN: double C2-like domain-containing protein gamma n=1 Tax=Phascolarctos cinereus TaxID=38626 RepID=A0A6P5IRE0_PHACI|nr:LOW QUALITY PROTEIN: double C2-like domain-containing protein gamma [Phascolarctos cinereus]
MAGARGEKVTMQEHMAINVSPGPISPIRQISDYFPHFYPFAPALLRPRSAPLPALPNGRAPETALGSPMEEDGTPTAKPGGSQLCQCLEEEQDGDSDETSECSVPGVCQGVEWEGKEGGGALSFCPPSSLSLSGSETSLSPQSVNKHSCGTSVGTPRRPGEPGPHGQAPLSPPAALGSLEFTLLLDQQNCVLHCTIHRAKGLKPLDSGSIDTFVKANLLPGTSKASQLRTRTVRGSQGPRWDETLTYHGFTCQDAGRKTLWLCVCEESRLRRRAEPLGELRVPLKKLVPNVTRSFNICLEKRRLTKRPSSLDTTRGMSLYEEEVEAAGEERGRILLSLCYSSQWGGLLVGVLRCAHLAPMDANGYSDPFVRIFLRPNTGKKSKYKMTVWKKTLNPEFNEKFFYAGQREELAQKTLLVSVWDYDLGTAADFIGEGGGRGCGGEALGGLAELRHWSECLARSDRRLELWHLLDGAPPQLGD